MNEDIARRLAGLSEEQQRALLAELLRKKTAKPKTAHLSFAQERLWFIDQLEPGNAAYNMSNAVRLRGALDVMALEQGFQQVVQRHELLRTTFQMVDGEPRQVIAPALEVTLDVVDLSATPAAEQENEVQRLARKEAQRPFDLSRGPLVRCSLWRLAQDEHILLLIMHHIISDGWSLGVLVKEIITLGQAYAADQPNPLPALTLQYADYAVWQREWLQGDVLKGQLAYWKQRLAGAPASLELPTDYPRPSVQTHRGARLHFGLSQELSNGLQALGRSEGTTLFMTLLASFQVLLSRYSGQTDIVVGSPVANRNRIELEGLIGFFANTLVLRSKLSGDLSFCETLQRVAETCLGAYDHQDVPFEKLVEELQVPRDLSLNPLFQVSFVLQNPARSTPGLWGINMEPLTFETGAAKFDLSMYMQETPTGLSGFLEYNSDLFEPETIARMAEHFQVMLDGIVADPHQPLSELPLLTTREREQILVTWNATRAEYPQDKCIHELFEAQVERTPNAVALVFENQQLTYYQLNQRANQLAYYLQQHAVGPDVLVGICLERSLEMVISLLAILKAGGAYVPIDPAYPIERIYFMLEDARPAVLLTQQHLQPILPANGITTFCIDSQPETLNHFPSHNLHNITLPDNLAYMIYTSGSTGKPKGALNAHAGVCNRLLWMQAAYNLTDTDHVLQKTPFSFDVSVWEFFWPLITGARLVMARPEGHKDSAYLVDLIVQEQITTLHFVPSMLRVFLDEPKLEDCLSLKRVICSGEALPYELQQLFFSRLGAELHNLYGPTEAAVDVTYWACRRDNKRPIVPIGHPIANIQMYILDTYLRPMPVGVSGDLYIAGIGVGRGYSNRPDLTAERFIPNPFGAVAGARLYKTGDLARWLPDGNIEYLGRIDQQVKIRGFRIELGEIETALAALPEVRDVVVLAREDISLPGTDKRLVAYLVAQQGQNLPETSELRSRLLKSLPDYMLPAYFIQLEQLPLSPNGKLDRKALPAPDMARSEVGYVAPRTPAEETLVQIWADVLKLDKVGIRDNFFDLGGHSLLATQVVSRMRQAFNTELSLRVLFQAPTIAELAQAIQTDQGVEAAPAFVLLPRPAEIPLSFAQQRLWFIDQLEPGNVAYNIFNAARLYGVLDVGALEQGFKQTVQRHESLRTTFQAADGQPHQVITVDMPISLPLTDLSTLPQAERENEALRLAREEAQRPFDLAQGPLVRCSLLRLADQDHILLLTMHHIVSDGWSMGVLFNEIILLTQAYTARRENPLPALPLQYADFAVWQRNWLQGEVLDAQIAYWKKQLSGAPTALELPTDRPRPAVQTNHGTRLRVALPQELIDPLQTLSRQEDSTLFMTLLAAFQMLLARYSGQTDILVGSPVANRSRSELEGLIGFFANNLVLRTDLAGNPSFREALERVREACLGAYDHQDIPFEKVVDEVQVRRDLSRNPLFQVMFNLQNTPLNRSYPSDLSIQPLEIEQNTAYFDLRLTLQEAPTGLTGFLEYNTDLFEPETVELLFDSYRHILESWARNPKQRLTDIILPKALIARSEAAAARDFKRTITIASSFTAEPVEETLGFWMEELDLKSNIEFAPYNQIFQQLLDPASLFSLNKSGVNVVLLRFSDWLRDAQSANPAELLERNLTDLQNALSSTSQRCIVLTCPASPAELAITNRAETYLAMEQRLRQALSTNSNITLVSSSDLAKYYPVPQYYDPDTDELGHMPYTPPMYTAIGTMIARKIHTLRSAPYKVIVLDCDNTLWQGVCGEVGPHGVSPSTALQDFMLEQLHAGMLLCLCSKNEEADVWAVFDTHPDMLLKREHLISWRINWQSKSENIRSLANELKLGLDSFIFVDDNPVECAEVQANCPAVFTVQIPDDTPSIPHFLEHTWVFDHLRLTKEDLQRTESYKQNAARERLKAETLTFQDFLAGLALKVEISALTPSTLGRVAQLTERTNQFNFTTLRRTESELQTLYLEGDKTCLIVEVSDRFGEYGLVGVLIFGQSPAAIVVDTFLMSCRVLGRGVEHHMLSRLGEIALQKKLEHVEATYLPTAKNRPALDFLQMGEQFKQPLATGFRFEFPAGWAAAAVERFYNTEPAQPADDSKLSIPAASTAAQPANAERFSRIARELSDVEHIVLATKKQKRHLPSKQKTAYVAPRTTTEETLANIWQDLLQVEQVGIHDNFFTLGGDSLLSMRMVALAKQKAIQVTPKLVFQHQTLVALASAVNTILQEVQAEQGLVTGPVHFTCDQYWYLYRAAPYRIQPERWNMGVFLQVPAVLCGAENVDILEQAVQTIWRHHDGLRARFTHNGSTWQQYLMAPEEINPFSRIDLSAISDAEMSAVIQTQADQLQGSLDIVNGPLFRVAIFDLGSHRPGRLLIIAHHLVIDGFSLGILLKDFQDCYLQLRQGLPIQLPPKTISIRQWTELLHQYAQSATVYQELDYWLNLPWEDVLPLPVDHPDGYRYDSVPAQHSISINFTSEETDLILRDISTFYQTSPLHILLMALAQTIAHWTGGEAVEVTCPILGRDIIPQGNNIDLSRTIGFLVLSKVLVLRKTEPDDLVEALRVVDEQLRQAPNQSCGYHFLSDLRGDAEITRQLKPLRKDELLFNYLGQMQAANAEPTWLSPAPEYQGDMQDPRQRPYHLLAITGLILENKLTLRWTYSPHLYRSDTITGLAEFFRETVLAFIERYQKDTEKNALKHA